MERTYKLIELVGISEKSYEEAIQNAVKKSLSSQIPFFPTLKQPKIS